MPPFSLLNYAVSSCGLLLDQEFLFLNTVTKLLSNNIFLSLTQTAHSFVMLGSITVLWAKTLNVGALHTILQKCD